jgi:adenylate cyclase
MSQSTQIKLRQLSVITGAWLIVGFLIALYDHLVLYTHNSLGPSGQYSFLFALALNSGSALIGSMLGGSLLVFFVNVRFADKSYGYTIMAVSISFVMVILIIVVVLGVVSVPIRTGQPLSDPVSVEAFRSFLLDSSRTKNIMIWFIVVAITQLLLQINSKFGQGAFGNIILGKYNTPKEENRIFMFLDLNSSTAMAERLGDQKYHALLKDFFADITDPILENKGEVYQYVGDEVVISWKQEEGIRNSRCIRCFFDIKLCIDQVKDKYLRRYGLVPSFKAGLHCGKVMAGEVGIIKRDITYSGNVLNTTSRILSMCKEFNAELISSADLVARLSLPCHYVARPLGSIRLRGKEKEVMLSALQPVMQPEHLPAPVIFTYPRFGTDTRSQICAA